MFYSWCDLNPVTFNVTLHHKGDNDTTEYINMTNTDHHDSHEFLLADEHVALITYDGADGPGYEAHTLNQTQLHGQVLTGGYSVHTHRDRETGTNTTKTRTQRQTHSFRLCSWQLAIAVRGLVCLHHCEQDNQILVV